MDIKTYERFLAESRDSVVKVDTPFGVGEMEALDYTRADRSEPIEVKVNGHSRMVIKKDISVLEWNSIH